jgi:hypothetical protein
MNSIGLLRLYALGLSFLGMQVQLGSIDVNVNDPRGLPIPAATVSAKNVESGALWTKETNSNGLCRLERLPPGQYNVEVKASGYKTAAFNSVMVKSSEEEPLKASMIPGENSITIEVTATAPIIEATWTGLLLLAPGVTSAAALGATDTESANYFVHFNDRYSSSFQTRNGINFIDKFDYFPLQANLSSEFTASASSGTNLEAKSKYLNFSASSSQVRSGGNIWHGSLVGVFNDTALNARSAFDQQSRQSGDHEFDIVATIGGPILRDKIHVFLGLANDSHKFGEAVLATVPTTQNLLDAISALGGTGLPSSSNSAVNPGIRQLLSQCESQRNCAGGTSLWPQVVYPQRQFFNSISELHSSQDAFSGTAHLDSTTSLFQLSALYSGEHDHEILPSSPSRADLLSANSTKDISESHVGGITLSKPLTEQTIVSGSFAISKTSFTRAPVGLFGDLPRGVPQIIIFGFSSIGPSPFDDGSSRNELNFHAQGELALTRGFHNATIGYEFEHLSGTFEDEANGRGRLLFQNLAEFFEGRPLVGSINSRVAPSRLAQSDHGVYAQDNIRMTQSLVLNVGLRWEYHGAPVADRHFFSYSPKIGLQELNKLYAPDLNDFAPRLGLGYSLGGWLFRMGAAVLYNTIPLESIAGQIQNNTFHPGLAFNSPTVQSSPVVLLQPITVNSLFNAVPGQNISADVWSIGSQRTPYTTAYTATLKPPTGSKFTVLIGYSGSAGRKLPRVIDLNAPILPGLTRPFSNAAIISPQLPVTPFVVDSLVNSSTSSFNSLQALLGVTDYRGFSGSIRWEWSHSIDDASDVIDLLPNASLPDGGEGNSREKASSNFDVRHFLKFDASYNTGNNFTRYGLQNVGIFISGNFSTGQHFNPIFGDQTDPFGMRDFAFRPDLLQGTNEVNSDPLRRIPQADFSLPCFVAGPVSTVGGCTIGTSHLGSLPRNFFSGPPFVALSMRLSKSFLLGERVRSTVAADIFNVSNTPYFPMISSAFSDRIGFKGLGPNGVAGGSCNANSPDCFLSNWRSNQGRRVEVSAKLNF